jgi:hypothetical protein
MATVDTLRNNEVVKLTEEQILILQLSDKDIETGKLISQEQLDKNDLDFFTELLI